jgi:hypothetical protein
MNRWTWQVAVTSSTLKVSIDSGQRPKALAGLMSTLDTALPFEVAGKIDRRGAVTVSLPVLPPRRDKIPGHHAPGGATSDSGESKIRTSIGLDGKDAGSSLVTNSAKIPSLTPSIQMCIKIGRSPGVPSP